MKCVNSEVRTGSSGRYAAYLAMAAAIGEDESVREAAGRALQRRHSIVTVV